MSIYLRIILVVISMLSMMNVMKRVRRFKLQIENSIFWIIFSLLLILVAVFPDPMFWLADLLEIAETADQTFLDFEFRTFSDISKRDRTHVQFRFQ